MSSPQVLALKWRPHNFTEMIGQEHILPALINSLNQKRLHHAYLFTGTRGVGKTSIARILAKCLNCEKGISSTPCNTCGACTSIDQGNFIDLIEVDAASRTKVEDTRELLDNVQYSPSEGRFKIYLIDEVHMLSGHSFNALLKTLEEPPEHVKFLLATTDPQRLPVTVLSRCLQFHLKHIAPATLALHLEDILEKEQIEYEKPALALLGDAAKGSVRDSLSLLDQAIAYSNHNVTTDSVRQLLGYINDKDLLKLITALVDNNANDLLSAVDDIALYTSDFTQLLESLLANLHRMAVLQFVPSDEDQPLSHFAKVLPKEQVQLYYQIALIGLRDLDLAPDARAGLEMVLLRMLAFQPASPGKTQLTEKTKTDEKPAQFAAQNTSELTKNWTNIVNRLQLTGMAQALASHCSVKSFDGTELRLLLSKKHQPILSTKLEDRLQHALSSHFDKAISLRIDTGESSDTPAIKRQAQEEAALSTANDAIKNDIYVQTLVDVFDATLQPGSTKAVETTSDTH